MMKETEYKETPEFYKFLYVVAGGIIYALGVNLFVVPLGLYSGGIVGIAQIIRTMILELTPITIPENIDIAGIINFLLNVPLFVIAFKSISRKFFFKTLLCVIAQTIAFTFIPTNLILEDVLSSCLIGGLISGFGIGLALRSSGSGGGLDILGVYFTKKLPGFSVGKIYVLVNVFVYGFCAIMFDVETAIYSIIYMFVFSMVLDKTHYQNINMTAMIFTKNEQVQQLIMKETGRGVTYWKGAGAYTNTETLVLMTVISKYEVPHIKKIIYDHDPKAFVIFSEGMSISGNFEKHL